MFVRDRIGIGQCPAAADISGEFEYLAIVDVVHGKPVRFRV
jgi:hypothetical protein